MDMQNDNDGCDVGAEQEEEAEEKVQALACHHIHK